VVVIAVTTMLDDNHAVMVTIPIPMPIMVAVFTTLFDDHLAFLGLRGGDDGKGEADGRSRRKKQGKFAHMSFLGFVRFVAGAQCVCRSRGSE
jgi:hypothetical protein